MKEPKFLFDEGVKEIMMSLLSLGAMAYEADYVAKQLNNRPEPIEQKIEALSKAKKVKPNISFDQAAKKLMDMYAHENDVEKPKISNETTNHNRLIKFVKKHEKFSDKPFWDYKQYSIGYGTKAKPGDVRITEKEASNRLIKEIENRRNRVSEIGKQWGYNWNDDQIDALTSFAFNIGSLSGLTNNGKRDNNTISKMILKYNKADGVPLAGLTKRRHEEHLMFNSKI